MVLAASFVVLELLGFSLANFATKDSWTELAGFILLQPVQILLNLIDSQFQLTRGIRDGDAVLLVTLISLPLNVLFGYWVWRGWRKLRRSMRRRKYAPGTPYGPAPVPKREPKRVPSSVGSARINTRLETQPDLNMLATADGVNAEQPAGEQLRK